ncbi:hypothetical protein Sjap_010895 [Stephania japonica]|uniref:Adenosylhomocysteinase n=1 Tax=Stephania japonica TaxID=461633 RepID=A0AAP0JAF4_9MAGN
MWGYKPFFRRAMLETSDFLKEDCLKINCSLSLSATLIVSKSEKSEISSIGNGVACREDLVGREYKVKDLSQADFAASRSSSPRSRCPINGLPYRIQPIAAVQGRQDHRVPPHDDPDRRPHRDPYRPSAEVRRCSRNIFSTQDHATAAIARDNAAVFALKGETLQSTWWCMERALDRGPGGGPNRSSTMAGMLRCDSRGGEGERRSLRRVGRFRTRTRRQCGVSDCATIIRDGLKSDPKKYHKMKERLVGVSEETTTGVKRSYTRCEIAGTLLFPAINVNDSVTKSKFDNLYGCLTLSPDGSMRATNVMITGKVALVADYGDVGKGCAAALKQVGARVIVTEIDPICALQATMDGLQVLTLEDVSDVDIFVTTTGNKDIIMVDHMR